MKTIHNYYSTKEYLSIKKVKSLDPIKTVPEMTIDYTKVYTLDDAYRIRINSDYTIQILHGNSRSKDYALRTLKRLIQSGDLQTGLIEDGPDFKLRGIIEGFYGEPWTNEDRKDMIKFLSKERLNSYIYAPKDDPYHRDKWREAYPKDKFQELIDLISLAKKHHIDFYFSISPGIDFNFTKEADFKILFDKLQTVMDQGVSHFSILLDDIDYSLSEEDTTQFETPGKAHAYICNQVYDFLQNNNPSSTLIMCPTEYWQNYDTPYRNDLKNHLDEDISVFWTGFRVIAKHITNEDGRNVKSYFGHDLILWDNYPVNDATRDLIFMGPLVNRGDKLYESHEGMVSNPMIQWSLSKLPIMTMADYMWNAGAYNPNRSFEDAIKRFVPSDKWIEPMKNLLENFRYSILSHDTINYLEQAIQNKNITPLKEYYEKLMSFVKTLHDYPDTQFIKQMKPWFNRIKFDYELIQAMDKNDEKEIKTYTKQIETQPATVGSNIAVKYAHKLGYYNKDIYKTYRHHFWEE